MGKAPAFQFYVKDWLSDPQLQCVSASSRGVWIDALCLMWQSPERGKLIGSEEELSKLLRATNGDFEQFMNDLKRHQFADVTICNNEITLINRRMHREQKERDNTRLRVNRFRSNAKSNVNVTPPSPSPSPSADLKDIYREYFLTFWNEYPKKVGKSKAAQIFQKIKPNESLLKVMLVKIAQFKRMPQWNDDGGRFIPNPATWLSQERWNDETISLQSESAYPRADPPLPDGGKRDPDGKKRIQELLAKITKDPVEAAHAD